jgi:rod shape determining protein RodA
MTSDIILSKRSKLFHSLHIDLPLLIGLILLCVYGLFVLYSAADQDMDMVERQLLRLALGFGTMFGIAQISPTHLYRWSPWLFIFATAMLLAVLILGVIGKGAQRWLDLGVMRFQPSELTKIAVPMMIAWYLSNTYLPPSIMRTLVAITLTLMPVLLIAKQPDLGTALLVASSGIFALFLAGISWSIMGIFAGTVASLAPAIWLLLHDYQKKRVITLFMPESDPLGAGYHIIQSKIAIGSGGIYGKGWLHGTQSHLDFLPESHTDFIFAVLSEELGLIGILLLMLLYLFIILRGLYIASQAQNTYGRLLAGSLTLVFFVYFFVNTGMVTGMLPVVGVPLPLVSYGGTSLVTIMASFGILMSVHTHRKLIFI